jgi:hypothetical protein
MLRFLVVAIWGVNVFLLPSSASAQAFGEYGRAVGSLPQGQGVTRTPGGANHGQVGGGVGEISGRKLPSRLVVATANAGLFPRQDEQSEKIAQLTAGEKLLPMVQSEGGSVWYMVKTSAGLIGWVKSNDVRAEKQ